MNLILDPSIVIKWYIPEILSDEAIALKEWIIDKEALIAVPELFFVESANVIWKKLTVRKEISSSDANSIFSEIMNLPFQRIPNHQVLAPAYEMASHFGITVYDAIYLATSYQFKAKFVTADTSLSRRMSRTGLSMLIVPLTHWKLRLLPRTE